MILPELMLHTLAGQTELFSAIDSPEECKDRRWFKKYPHTFDYQYNSRGFRDREWPDDLDRAIWCIGDSFTVGVGSPQSHSWPSVLSQLTGVHTVNVSMTGASNDWISKVAGLIADSVTPRCMVIMWSYINRREMPIDQHRDQKWKTFYHDIQDQTWPECELFADIAKLPSPILEEIKNVYLTDSPFRLNQSNDIELDLAESSDEHRRLHFVDLDRDLENFQHCLDSTNNITAGNALIHSAVPGFAAPGQQFDTALMMLHHDRVALDPPKIVDWARDRHHFDIKTSENFCRQVIDLL